MNAVDQYLSVQNGIIQLLKEIQSLHENWRNRPQSDDTDIRDQLRKSIRTFEWDLEELKDIIIIADRDPSSLNLSTSDVNTRHVFVRQARETIKKVKLDLTCSKPPALPIDFPIQPVMPGVRLPEEANKFSLPNPSINPVDQQKRLVNEQDERLEQLHSSIGTLKDMSHRIGSEIGEQVALLDDFNNEMMHTDTRLDSITKRTARLLHLSTDKRQWWAIGILLLTLILILIFLVVL